MNYKEDEEKYIKVSRMLHEIASKLRKASMESPIALNTTLESITSKDALTTMIQKRWLDYHAKYPDAILTQAAFFTFAGEFFYYGYALAKEEASEEASRKASEVNKVLNAFWENVSGGSDRSRLIVNGTVYEWDISDHNEPVQDEKPPFDQGNE